MGLAILIVTVIGVGGVVYHFERAKHANVQCRFERRTDHEGPVECLIIRNSGWAVAHDVDVKVLGATDGRTADNCIVGREILPLESLGLGEEVPFGCVRALGDPWPWTVELSWSDKSGSNVATMTVPEDDETAPFE